MAELGFLWLEITGRCQLSCQHCYADSGPTGSHGSMTTDDWCRVIDEAAELGVGSVQFIGGEPTLHPDLAELVRCAAGHGLDVEVFTNLVRISDRLWDAFVEHGVRLATSYYSDRREQHEAVTGRVGSASRTTDNIAGAVRRGIPLRVGIIDLHDDQRVEQAAERLRSMGVTQIGMDRLRQVGRGDAGRAGPSLDQLCGTCAGPVLAIGPEGDAWPCVFSRWLPVGNVLRSSLAEIVAGAALAGTRADIAAAKVTSADCQPECWPSCQPSCNPMCLPYAKPPSRAGSAVVDVEVT